jgi:hypothetical protein
MSSPTGEGLEPLLDVCEGHPQRAMLLAHHLYLQTRPGEAADVEAWVRAEHAARQEAAGEIHVLWQGCSELERRVLKMIAHRTIPLASREAQVRFDLPKTGSAKQAVERLARDGHIIEDPTSRTGWKITDPFLAAWLRDQDVTS